MPGSRNAQYPHYLEQDGWVSRYLRPEYVNPTVYHTGNLARAIPSAGRLPVSFLHSGLYGCL